MTIIYIIWFLGMKKVFVGIFIFAISISSWRTYQLTDSDYTVIETAEEKILTIIEQNTHRTIEKVITALETIQNTRTLSPRKTEILEVMIADMYWYTGHQDSNILTQEDCYEDEYYDIQDQWCYPIDDENEEITETQQEETVSYEYDTHTHTFHEVWDDYEEYQIYAKYHIEDWTAQLVSWESEQVHIQIRQAFSVLFPQRYLALIGELHFFNDDSSDVWAYVERIQDNTTQWVIAFNVSWINPTDDQELYIHEMAHIITLEEKQLAFSTPDDANETIIQRHEQKCTTYHIWEWCLLDWSYLDTFIDRFRDDEMRATAEEDENWVEFYESDFVTDYASTNPWEDIAESFAFFVTQPKKHTFQQIAWEKINLFYEFKELVELRAYIRERLTK